MRCDDVQSINPRCILLTGLGLRLYLNRTKTTGPDKPQEVQAFIHRQTSLTGIIGIGYAIWNSEAFSFRRDCLVMEATAKWGGASRKFLTPAGLASNIKQLLGMLGTPRHVNGAWSVINTTLLLPDSLEDYYTGHSPRNWLTSIGVVLGFTKEETLPWQVDDRHDGQRRVREDGQTDHHEGPDRSQQGCHHWTSL